MNGRAAGNFRQILFAICTGVAIALSGGSAAGHDFKVLYSFCGKPDCADGVTPEASLLLDEAGHLFGVTSDGGRHHYGVAFKLTQDDTGGWVYKVIHTFCTSGKKVLCKDGLEPRGGLIMDVAGDLYGVTRQGGVSNAGTVFELVPRSGRWQYKLLHSFCFCAEDGGLPQAGLAYRGQSSGALYDGISPLYGTTREGGVYGAGTAYVIIPVQNAVRWREKVIHDFCTNDVCGDGAHPSSNLVMDNSGILFGTTDDGGGNFGFFGPGAGNVFQLNLSGKQWTETVLYDLCAQENCTDGQEPGPLTLDSSGALYGVAYLGGTSCPNSYGCGTAFKIVPDGAQSQFKVINYFCSQENCTDGRDPQGIVMGNSGHLFAVTRFGGGNDIDDSGIGGGAIVQLGASPKTVLSFCAKTDCKDGEYPSANLVVGPSGSLLGVTQSGGANGGLYFGTVFELKP